MGLSQALGRGGLAFWLMRLRTNSTPATDCGNHSIYVKAFGQNLLTYHQFFQSLVEIQDISQSWFRCD